jgi:hypothetical protein
MQSPVKRAVHCVNRMRPLDGFAAPFQCDQPHRHVDPPDNQHAIFALNLPGNIGGEFPIAGVELALPAPPNVPTIQPAVAAIT